MQIPPDFDPFRCFFQNFDYLGEEEKNLNYDLNSAGENNQWPYYGALRYFFLPDLGANYSSKDR